MRGVAPLLVGERLTNIEVRRPDLRWPIPVDFRQRLQGAVVTRVGRRAKYGLIETDRGDSVILHLGMSGRLRLNPPEDEKHDHVLLETARGRVALNDPRRFGSLHIIETDHIEAHPLIAACGPEPLGPGFDSAHLRRVTKDSQSPVKALLLDGKRVAGLGNIYVCEALYEAGIRPTRKGTRLGRAEIERLTETIRGVLTRAIAAGGSSLRDYAQPSGELGYFQHDFRVYGREGEACHGCGGAIRRIVQSGRSSFYCPTCQK